MATATTRTAHTSDVPDVAQKIREQLISTVQQGQQLSVAAARTWVKAVSVLPVADLPKVPGVPAIPDVESATIFTFDVAADLLSAQRDFALQLANVLVTEKSS
jgi:hypothetical protein